MAAHDVFHAKKCVFIVILVSCNKCTIESYIYSPVLSNLLNSLQKSNKMRDLLDKPHILLLFIDSLNKFNKK